MTINLSAPLTTELKPRIVVIGVGGAGGNAVNNMITSGLEGVDFIVANTDAQALAQSQAERQIQLGASITQGLGCGARPDVGRAAAEEAIDQIIDHMGGAHMAFITAGMGGGTGTGAAPVIAEALREQGILTVGVVTKPFHFEGRQRMTIAEGGIENLQAFVDTLIIIPNQNLFRIANEKTTFADAFAMADNVLHSGVRGITDLMVLPGLINLDFADVKTVMGEMGKAMMGTGESEGERRAIEAAEAAIANPLLDDVSMKGAHGVLINITGGMDLTLYEVDEAANRIREEVDPDANIIVGSALDEALNGRMRVSLVATGIDADTAAVRSPNAMPRLAAIGGRSLAGAEQPETDAQVDIPPMAAAPAAPPAPQARPATPGRQPDATAPASMMPSAMRAVVAERAAMATQTEAAHQRPVDETAFTFEPDPAPHADPEPEAEADLLTLGDGELVPPPKPIQPAPEPFAFARPAQMPADAPGERPFIAPEPLAPKRVHDALGRGSDWADSMVQPSDRSAEPRRARGLAARLWRRTPVAQEQPTVKVRPVEPAAARPPRPAQPAAAPVAAAVERPPVQSPPADRPVVKSEDDDLLEIPSFLRRQAN